MSQNLKGTHEALAEQMVCVYNKDKSVSHKTAEDVTAGSNLKALWVCDKPELGHGSYVAVIKDRAKVNGSGCPTCKGKRVEKGINDLATTHVDLSAQMLWVYESDGNTVSDLTVHSVSAGSSRKCEWACDKPELGHSSYKATVKNRVNGRGCPTCSSHRVEASINDFATKNEVLASQLLFIYEIDGVTVSKMTAHDVTLSSTFKAEWVCANKELNHGSYSARICDRTKVNGTGCPLCATGKTEGLFRDSFNKHAKNHFVSARIPLERESFKSGMIQVDMFSDELMVAVEYDGAYAHGSVRNADKNITTEECLARDIESTVALIKAGYKVIRIRECDRKEKLPFLELAEEYASNLYQVTYKSFGKDKHDIDELVKSIIKEKEDWFLPTVDNKSAPLSVL